MRIFGLKPGSKSRWSETAGVLQLLHMADIQTPPWGDPEPGTKRRGRPWLWIGLPLFLGAVVVAGLVAAVFTTGLGTTRIWADVSLIFVLLPLCFMGFIPLVVLIALSYGTARLLGWLPQPMDQFVRIMERVERETRRGGVLVARPMIALQGLMATVETFLRGLIEIFR